MIRILTHSDKRRVRLTRLWAILVLLLAVPPSYSAPQWIKVTSPNFEMFTSAGEGAAKRTLQDFEQIRSFFIEVTQAKSAPPLPVRIIAVRSRKEFEPYRARESSSAYYLSGRERDYIVMGKIGADTRPIAIHEYIHLLVRHSGRLRPHNYRIHPCTATGHLRRHCPHNPRIHPCTGPESCSNPHA